MKTFTRTAASFPPIVPAEADAALKAAEPTRSVKVIALDDDPTGTQTVHDIFVYTDWDRDSVRQGLDDADRLFFILTNSRAFSVSETVRVHEEIARNIASQTDNFVLVSRGDSTLRGHYPIETDVLRRALAENGYKTDGEIIYPFFPEGGRYTVENIHYVKYGDVLVPAGETEFAKDKTFGYTESDLTKWIEEKTSGAYKAKDVTTVTLDELRRQDYDGITAKLMGVSNGKVIVNSLTYDDVKVFTTAFWRAWSMGKRFIIRSAAAFVKVLGGVTDKEPLTSEELKMNVKSRRGGLIIAGSHVKKTTDQLETLRGVPGLTFLELNQHLALDEAAFEAEADRVAKQADARLASGETAVIMTRRERFDLGTGDKAAELDLAAKISDKLCGIVRKLTHSPRFVIAKGGITSSDTAIKGLGIKKALVLGQILPGVPVWRAGSETRFPGLTYVVFPGNVGDEHALMEAVKKLI
ncbi:MAG: hydroxyacid dehydrogenase [Clostridiales bacterium]|jgi:uncharacterized protein YgbK (DUF1537 family)|nr:hydroxyacid dehydrogenase [Clostridiales bacterium]